VTSPTDLTAVTPRLLYRVEEAAYLLNISRTRVFELLRSDQLRSVTHGRTRLIPHAALLEFVQRLEEDY
jgi:excisionase family DNA binding protein